MKSAGRAAFKVAAVFCAVSILWILFSDAAVNLLPDSISAGLQTIKGLLFVLVTTATLYVLVLRYATEADFAVERAQASEQTLSQLIETAPVGVVRLDSEGRITFLNTTAVGLLGMVAGEAIGSRLQDVLHDSDDADGFFEGLPAGDVGGIIMRGAPGDEARALMARATQDTGASGQGGTIVAFSDVTDAHASAVRLEALTDGYRYLGMAGNAMTVARYPDDLLRTQVELAAASGGFSAAWAAVIDSDTGVVRHHADASLQPFAREFDAAGIVWSSQLSGASSGDRVAVFNDIPSDVLNPLAEPARARGANSAAVISLTRGTDAAAVFVVFSERTGDFDSDKVALLRALAVPLQLAFTSMEDGIAGTASDVRGAQDPCLAVPVPAWIIDRQTLEFLAVNDAAVRRYEYARDDFAGLTLLDIGPHDDAARMRLAVEGVTDGVAEMGRWTQQDRSGRRFQAVLYCQAIRRQSRPALLMLAVEIG